MKYLVTGATAFAGCHLTQLLLKEGHEVWATSRRTNGSETDVLDVLSHEEFERVHWLFCSLTNRSSCFDVFREQKFDGAFHLAAQSHPPTGFARPFYTQEVNVVGSLNLLEAITELQPEVHFMFCSTSEVYGAPELKEGEKIDEGFQIAPMNPYGASKAAVDLFFQERIRNNFLNGFITRAFSHTGPKRGKIFSISSDAYQIAGILNGSCENVVKVGKGHVVEATGKAEVKPRVVDQHDGVRTFLVGPSYQVTEYADHPGKVPNHFDQADYSELGGIHQDLDALAQHGLAAHVHLHQSTRSNRSVRIIRGNKTA